MRRLNLFCSFVLLFFFISTANANTSHTVKKGDTLYKISKKFNVSESEIKKANNLKSNRLNIGMKLTIPEKNSSKSNENLSTEKPQHNTAEVKIYTVKKGDNLWRLAKKFNISTEELKEINELQGNSLKAGQKLFISKRAYESSTEDIIKAIQANYERKTTPVITSGRLEEIKEMYNSEDLSKMSIKERLILFAKKMLDIPYKFGGNSLLGLDCSAYVQKVYGIAGINLPRSAREQFNIGEPVYKDELSIGDLVFFRTYASFPSHVGIYLGNNLFIHASTQSKKVVIDSLESPYFTKRFIGAKRLLNEEYKTAIESPNDKH